jgi:ribonuclease VapC
MIVDTSALIAILRSEKEAESFTRKILASSSVRISAGTLVEARIVAERDGGAKELEELIALCGIEVMSVDATQADIAIDAFRRFGKGRHKASLNFGDLFAYALARAEGAPILFKGEDFAHTDLSPAI